MQDRIDMWCVMSVYNGHVFECGCFFFSSRRRHTRFDCDWSSDVCSSDLPFVIGDVASLVASASALEETDSAGRTPSTAEVSSGTGVVAAASSTGAINDSSMGACDSGVASIAASFFFLLNICYSYLLSYHYLLA